MRKTVYFDKYVPYTLERNEDGVRIEKKLKLSSLFNALASSPTGKSLREVFGEKYRLQICKYHELDNIWELQILHLRNAVLPGVADEESNFELMVLPDGQYPTESSTVLYSPDADILYFQRNIVCMSVKRMEQYLCMMLPEETSVLFKPILARNRIDRITEHASYKKVILACSIDHSRKNKNSNLGKLLDEYAKYQGAVINITIGMGRKRGRLSSVEASKLVQEAYQASDIQTLKVQMDSNGLTNYEWLDLMLDREFYSFEVKYTKDDPITHEKLFASCYEAMMNEK